MALPLVMCALMWGVKWRAANPVPTKEDLEVRAMMSQADYVDFDYSLYHYNKADTSGGSTMLSEKELTEFISCFHVLPYRVGELGVPINSNQAVQIFFRFIKTKKNVNIYLDVPLRAGSVTVREPMGKVKTKLHPSAGSIILGDSTGMRDYKLHPATTKRWIELLLAHPRIGPELRARMQR